MSTYLIHALNIAREYRAELGYQHGVVIVHDGHVNGWCNELRNPEQWVAGCIAVDSQDTCWLAVGGNDYDGAERWEPFTHLQTASPSTPLTDIEPRYLPESMIDAAHKARVAAQLRRLKAQTAEALQAAGGWQTTPDALAPDSDDSVATAAELRSGRIATDPASHSSHDKGTI